MNDKNEDYISKFKKFLYDKSLEYYLYIDRLENPPFKDIIDFCDGDYSKLVDYDSNGKDSYIRDRKNFVRDIELFVDMALKSGELKGKSHDKLVLNYINSLEVYRSMLLFSKEYGISIENIEQGIILQDYLKSFYHELCRKYSVGKTGSKSEYELLELKSMGEEAQKINLLLEDDGSLLEPLSDYETLFMLIEESGLSLLEQEKVLSKVLLSSIEVFQILEPEKEMDITEYLSREQLEVVNCARDIYEDNLDSFELISHSDEIKSYIHLFRDLKSRNLDTYDNYFGSYTADYIYRLMCLSDIDSYLKDFITSAKKSVNDPSIDEYKQLCFNELVDVISSFNELKKDEEVSEVSEVETLDIDLYDVIYLCDKNGYAYIEDELTGTYNNREYHKKVSNMILKLRNRSDVSNPVVNFNRWPIFVINKGELALSYLNLGNNLKVVITVGDMAGNDDIYDKTVSIVNKNPSYINNLISCASNVSTKEQLVLDNRQAVQQVDGLLAGSTFKRRRG